VTHAYRVQALDRRFFGVCIGIVEDNDDPEKQGRVRVSYPWLDDATVSEWCRVLQPYAGKDFGAFFIPEKKCEVLIAFMHGDMHEPVIVGGLYNGKDTPPTHHQGSSKDVKLIKTKAGHVVRLDDSAQERAVELKTALGHDLLLDDKNQQIALTSKLGHKVLLDDKNAKIEITAMGGVGKITIEATGQITVQGTVITFKGTAITLAAAQVSLGG
jgi:uncharacterized protein involved in type VI secretion and phage assembly